MSSPNQKSRFAALVADAKKRIQEITTDGLRARLSRTDAAPPLVIDVRETPETARGRIPGAVLLPRGLLEGGIEEIAPDPDAEIVLYCAGGNRSALSADNLVRMGYTRVSSLAGGFAAWQAANPPKGREA